MLRLFWHLSEPVLHCHIRFQSWRLASTVRCYHHDGGDIPHPPQLEELSSPSDCDKARSWVAEFRSQYIPRSVVDFTFSRSSGPGGQNVNKVNTKATLRCPIGSNWIPCWAQPELRRSPFFASSSQALVISSTRTRSQAQNADDCLAKLHALVLSASSAAIKNEPSEEQKARVRGLERAEKARRSKEKGKRSAIKRARSKRDWD